jgi:hypothetical protein
MTPEWKKGKIVSDALFQYLGELAHASSRIGHTTKKAIGWLLRFAKLDLSKLSIGDFTNLQYELTSFRQDGVLNEKKALAYVTGQPIVSGYDCRPRTLPEDGLITLSEMIEFQTLVRQTVERIREKRMTLFTFSSLERCLYFDPTQSTVFLLGKAIDRPPRWVLVTTMENPMESLTYAMLDLLKDHANAITQCPEFAHPKCQGLFLAERKNQNFCSVTCQSRVATRRYRLERGLISGRPRGRPRKMTTIRTTRITQHHLDARKRRRQHGKTTR